MLSFAAIAPHPAIAVPEISKEGVEKVVQTVNGFQILKQELYNSKPDVLIFITPHVTDVEDVFTINQNKELSLNLKEFGDLTERYILRNAIGLGYKIRERVESSLPVRLVENDSLDYGSAITHLNLATNLRQVPIVIIGTANKLDLATHYQFGQEILKPLDNTTQRIAIVASADLSHDQTEQSNIEDNKKFDRQVISLIEQNKISQFLNLPADSQAFQTACGLRPIALLLGLLKNKNHQAAVVSYERSVGIGYANILIRII